MKHLIILGFAMLPICSSCQTKEEISNEVTITGQIENYDETVLRFRDFMGTSDWETKIEVIDGKFSMNLPLDRPAIKKLYFGRTGKNIISPGKTLEISFDALNPNGTFSFGGSLARENIILDSLRIKEGMLNMRYLSTESLDNAARYLDSISLANILYIENLIGDKTVATDFKEYANALTEYNIAYRKIMLGERKNEQPENYYDFLNQLSLENDVYLDILEYRVFLNEYIAMKSNERLNKFDSVNISDPDAVFNESLTHIAAKQC